MRPSMRREAEPPSVGEAAAFVDAFVDAFFAAGFAAFRVGFLAVFGAVFLAVFFIVALRPVILFALQCPRMTRLGDRARRRLFLAILAAGLAAAVVIEIRATAPDANPLGYDPADTKQYLRQMEVYGGTANVLASEFRIWFASLWHGERLALTIAVLTVVAAGAFWFFTRPIEPEVEPVRTPRGP